MNDFGAPGPGGSMGQCAVCGDSFIKEAIIGCPVTTFTVDCIRNTMYAHDKCVDVLKASLTAAGDVDSTKLPDGPLRKALQPLLEADTHD